MISLRAAGTRPLKWLIFAAPVIFFAVFYAYPLLTIVQVSLAREGRLDLLPFAELVVSPYYRGIFGFTLGQAVLSTVLTVGLALPGAYVLARYEFRGKGLLQALMVLPFVLPTVVVAAAFSALIGPRGVVNTLLMQALGLNEPPVALERTLALILIVHVFYNYAVALRIISGYWAVISPQAEDAARVLGAHGWRLWWEIRLPLLRPALLAAAALVFVFTFTSFGVIVILGGPRFTTVEVEIYRQATSLFNLPAAAALSIVQLLTMMVMMLIYTRLQRRITLDLQAGRLVARRPTTLRKKIVVGSTVIMQAVFLLTPLAALVLRALQTGDGLSLRYFQALSSNPRGSVLFVPPLNAVGNSVGFAAITTILALVLGMITAYLLVRGAAWMGRLLDALFMLPLATSAVTLGFGFIIALDEPPLNLRSSVLLIPIAHTLVALPFVVRSVLPALRAISPSVRDAAAVLGAPPSAVFRLVELPLISRGLIVGATFAFTISMGEFGASLFVARPDTPTIPIVIYRLLGQPGAVNYGQAMAMSSILMLVCAAAFVLIGRVRIAGVGEF